MTRTRKSICVEEHELYETWRWLIRAYTANQMVCERWREFWSFVEDIGSHPGKDFRFNRHYADKPYGPGNWRWKAKYVSTPHTREYRKLYMQKWMAEKREKDPSYEHDQALHKQYKIRVEDYNRILDAQNGVCAICKGNEKSIAHTSNKIRNLTVDHCHATGKVRGILCSRCNRGLGFFQDNLENLKSAIQYLGG